MGREMPYLRALNRDILASVDTTGMSPAEKMVFKKEKMRKMKMRTLTHAVRKLDSSGPKVKAKDIVKGTKK